MALTRDIIWNAERSNNGITRKPAVRRAFLLFISFEFRYDHCFVYAHIVKPCFHLADFIVVHICAELIVGHKAIIGGAKIIKVSLCIWAVPAYV